MRAIQKSGAPFFRRLFGAIHLSGGAALNVIYFFGGILASQGAVFGSFAPFGVAFCAAVPYGSCFSASIGACMGYIILQGSAAFRCVASVVTVFALRWLFGDLPKISCARLFAPLISALPLMLTGGVMILAQGRGTGSFAKCAAEAMLAAAGAYFIGETARLAAGKRGVRTFDQQEIACIMMTCCIFLLSAGSLTVGGISVGRILAFAAVLIAAYCGAAAGGCIGGTAVGTVFGLSSGDFGFLALSASFGGLMAGIFSYIGRVGSAAAFVLCSAVVSLSNGVTAESAFVFYETVFASVLFLVIPKDILDKLANFVTPRRSSGESDALRRGVIMRLDLASKAIKGINEAVSAVADKLGEYCSDELQSVFARSADENCSRCGMRAFCMSEGEEKHLSKLSALSPILENGEKADGHDVRRILGKRCCKPDALADSINENYAGYKCYLAAKGRAAQMRGVVAGQFSGLAEILGNLRDEFELCRSCDEAAAERICAFLKVRGFLPIECSVKDDIYGRTTVDMELSGDDRGRLRKNDLSDEISKLCGKRLAPAKIVTVGSRLRVTLCESPRLDVQVGTAQHVCGEGRLCGDSMNYFRDGRGRFIAVLSDGMGTGGRAAVDGSMAVSIISRLVKSGLGFDASLGAANSALMVKSDDESLATADILSIDLFSGDAEIMKAGAPVTFFRKSGKIIRVEPPSLPAGIMPDISLTHDELTLKDGDLIVMVSDGAVALSDEWIGAMMRDFEGDDVQSLVNDIIDEAMIGSKFGRDDDISVIGVRVMENTA